MSFVELFMFALKLIKLFGQILPGRLGEEMVGFSVRQGNVRKTMKNTIIPAIKNQNFFLKKKNLKILVIGTESCSKYDAISIGNKTDEVWTIDIKKRNYIYGVKNGKHITGSATELEKYFEEKYFDLVIFNGVIGWGINKHEDQIESIKSIHKVSKENALLMIGWNNNKSIDPLFSGIVSGLFKHQDFPGLPKRLLVTESTHVFDFFSKVDF